MIADLQNLTSATLCCLLPVPLLSSPFFSAQDGFKNQPKILRTVCFSGNQKFALKGQLPKIFSSYFIYHESTGFHSQKYAKNCGSEALKLRTSEKIAIVELRLQSNISLKSCGIGWWKCILQCAELRLWTQKKLHVPTSVSVIPCRCQRLLPAIRIVIYQKLIWNSCLILETWLLQEILAT